MENRIKVKIKQCYDTEENYITNNPVLLAGQLAYTEDRYGEYKIGDGTHAWNELEYVKNYFIGTKAEYIEANNKGLIRPGMIICITDDNDYCNIPVDDEMDETSEHVVLNSTITKYVNTHDLKDNTVSSSIPPIDGGVPFAGAEIVSDSIGLGNFLSQNRSGFYTISTQNKWYNVISNRHRNGYGDGNNYGLVFLSNLTDANADLIWDRQHQSTWQGQRTILDSVNSINYFSKGVKDTHNSNNITLSYGKAGMNYNEYTWLAGWNGYELRAIHKNQFMAEVYANNYWGMAPNGDTSLWVRTTSQGIIPYQGGGRGGGHQYLGTDSWYFANSYIDHMHGVDLNLSNNIVSSLTTSTWLAGNKGTAIINSTAAGSGYNCLFKMNSPNGVFTASSYNGEFGLQYTANSIINANNNSTTKRAILLNESGNTGFPGQVSANNFSAGGSSTFTTATITNLTVNGSMRLKNSTNYGMKLNFGDGDYVYLHEDTNDHLTIYGRSGITLNSSNNVLVPYCLTVGTGSGNGLKIGSYGRIVEASRNVGSDNYSSYVIELFGSNNYNYPHVLYRQFNSDFQIFPTSNGKGQYGDNYANMWYCIGAKTLYSSGGGVSVSDRNLKKDFELITDSLAENIIDGLIPTSFKYIDGDSGRRHYGLIAQDVEYLINKLGIDIIDFAPLCKVYPDKVIPFDVDNEEELVLEKDYTKTPLYHLRYEGFIGFLIKYSQNLKKENIQLKERVQILEERLSSIEDKITLLLNKS